VKNGEHLRMTVVIVAVMDVRPLQIKGSSLFAVNCRGG
jgi:hypothetical protein